jgi:hypothetical protein
LDGHLIVTIGNRVLMPLHINLKNEVINNYAVREPIIKKLSLRQILGRCQIEGVEGEVIRGNANRFARMGGITFGLRQEKWLRPTKSVILEGGASKASKPFPIMLIICYLQAIEINVHLSVHLARFGRINSGKQR